ncbi:MAG: MarR family transcriptional regulator [Candidatus Melainabacteria bacterium]|nr:MarR family transcriptional regulator [Candidatus Melainabacteria bacterium]
MPHKPQISSLEAHLGYWLRFVSNHVSHSFTIKVEAEGVTVAEWILMRQLFEHESANPSHLADSIGLTRGAVSKLIDRLARKNLATRSFGEKDRRYQSVALTVAGRKLVPKLAKLADENDHEFFGHLSLEQQSLLSALLKDIVRQQGWKNVPTD